jgi:hypothetical protein
MRIEFARTNSFGNHTVVDECRLPMGPLFFEFRSVTLMGKETFLLVKWMVPRSEHGSDSCFWMARHWELEMEIPKEPRTAVEKTPKAVLMERMTA